MQRLARRHTDGSDIGKGLVGGLLGGLAASWVMGFVMTGAQKLEQKRAQAADDDEDAYQRAWNAGEEQGGARRWQEQDAAELRQASEREPDGSEPEGSDADGEHGERQQDEQDDSATVKTAKAVSRTVFRRELPREKEQLAGQAVHYGFGGLMGALYGAAAEVWPAVTFGFGMPFGAGLWMVADEAVVPALRLGPPPTRAPVLVQAGGLLAHVVYGAVTDGVRCGLRRIW